MPQYIGKLLTFHYIFVFLGIFALVLKSDCIFLQTDLVGESELGSVVQRIKVDPASSSTRLDDYMLLVPVFLLDHSWLFCSMLT